MTTIKSQDEICTIHGREGCFHRMKGQRSYFDLSDKEKKEIMDKAAKESSEAQQDLIAKVDSGSKETWEEQTK